MNARLYRLARRLGWRSAVENARDAMLVIDLERRQAYEIKARLPLQRNDSEALQPRRPKA